MTFPVTTAKVHVCGLSDRGLVRARNEDCWDCLVSQGFVVLADGMGGHKAGDIAAEAVVGRCCTCVKRLMPGSEGDLRWEALEDLCSVMRYVIKDANKYVRQLARKNPLWKGMGSTVCCLLFRGSSMIRGHLGDSRIYRFRDKKLTCLTRDDTLVRDMIDGGTVNEVEARCCAERHVLTQAIGVEPLIDPTLAVEDVEPEDLYLLCTDGLTEHLPDDEVERILCSSRDVDHALGLLVEAAKAQGGSDNVTVVLVRPQG